MKRLFCVHSTNTKGNLVVQPEDGLIFDEEMLVGEFFDCKEKAKMARDHYNKHYGAGYHVTRGEDHIGKHGIPSKKRTNKV